MMDFKDKLVIITGAARGIGRAIAFEYGAAGAKLIVLDVLADLIKSTGDDLRAEGYECHDFKCDLANDEETAALGEKIKKEIGVPDIIHNNAFYATSGTIKNIDLEGIRRAFEVSVLGYMKMVKAFVTEMIERKSGWIVNTASPNGIGPPKVFAEHGVPYNMCKAADISISQTMAAALKQYNIGVTVLYPGAVSTEASAKPHGKFMDPDYEAALRKFFLERAVPPKQAAKELLEGVRQQKFFWSTFAHFDKVLVEFAQNGMDPNQEYSWDG